MRYVNVKSQIWMLRSLSSLIACRGGDETHALWIECFTSECKIHKSIAGKESLVKTFVENMDCKTVSSRDARKMVDKAQGKADLELKLATLFSFESFGLQKFLVLAKELCERGVHSDAPKTRKVACTIMMRGLIVATYYLPGPITAAIRGENTSCDVSWELVHYPVKYLLEVGDVKSAKLFSPLFGRFSRVERIFQLPEDHAVSVAFISLVSTVIPFFGVGMSGGTSSIIDFVMLVFREVGNRVRHGIWKGRELVNMWHKFLAGIKPQMGELAMSVCEDMVSVEAMFLMMIKALSGSFDEYLFRMELDGISIVTMITGRLNRDVLVTFMGGLLSLMGWTLNKFPLVDELAELRTSVSENGKKKVRDFVVMFNNLLAELSRVTCKLLGGSNERMSDVLTTMVDMCALESYSTVRKAEFCCVFGSALTHSMTVGGSDGLKNFIRMMLSIVAENQSSELDVFADAFGYVLYALCNRSPELQKYVLRVILEATRPDSYGLFALIIPVYRSLVDIDATSNFIEEFVASEIFGDILVMSTKGEYSELVNDFIMLIHQMSLERPAIIFGSQSCLYLLNETLVHEQWYMVSTPCFRVGLSLAARYRDETSKRIVVSLIENVAGIFRKMAGDNGLLGVAVILAGYLTEAVESFDNEMLEAGARAGLLEGIVQLPSDVKTSEMVRICVKFFLALCQKLPRYIQQMNTENSSIVSAIEATIGNVELESEVVDLISQLVRDRFDRALIGNRGALKWLLRGTEGTKYEKRVMSTLLELCQLSSVNIYECFSCNIAHYIMNIASHEVFTEFGVPLLVVVGSTFFSPLTMNELMIGMRLGENGKRSARHRIIISCLFGLMLKSTRAPVSGFFHFRSEKKNGIFSHSIPGWYLAEPFSVVMTFKQAELQQSSAPILSMQSRALSGDVCEVVVKAGRLYFRQVTRGEETIIETTLGVDIGLWYKLIMVFDRGSLCCYLDNLMFGPISILKFDGSMKVDLTVGFGCVAGFAGSIGPVFFTRGTRVAAVSAAYKRFNSERVEMPMAFVKYVPWMSEGHVVLDVDADKSSAVMMGRAIPFWSTICDVCKSNNTFLKILPLFLHVNSEGEDGEGEPDKLDNYFVCLLDILRWLLNRGERMQHVFRNNGGFRLIAGFFAQINVRRFTTKVRKSLESIFPVLVVQALRSQMMEFIWLNFGLWGKCSYEFQIEMYNDSVPKIVQADRDSNMSSIDRTIVQMMLYQVHIPFDKSAWADKSLWLCPTEKRRQASQRNPFYKLTLEQIDAVRKAQWELLADVMNDQETMTSFCTVFMILASATNRGTKYGVLELLLKLSKDRNEYALMTIKMQSDYMFFLSMDIVATDEFIDVFVELILELTLLESEGVFQPEHLDGTVAIQVLANMFLSAELPKDVAAGLIQTCCSHMINSAYGLAERPELLMLAALIGRNVEESELVVCVQGICQAFIALPGVVTAVKKLCTWPIWILMLGVNAFDSSELCSEFICSILGALCRCGEKEELRRFFMTWDILQEFAHCDMSNMTSKCHQYLLVAAQAPTFNMDVRREIWAMGVTALLFPLDYSSPDGESVPISRSCLFKVPQELINLTPEQCESVAPRTRVDNENMDEATAEVLVESICAAISDHSNCDDADELTNVLHCMMTEMFMKWTDTASRDWLINHCADVDFESLMNAEFVDDIRRYRVPYALWFTNYLKDISASLGRSVITVDKTIVALCGSGQDEFRKTYRNASSVMVQNNRKLAGVLLSEYANTVVTSFAGERSFKWQCSSRVDGIGRNTFMTINKSFSHHRDASALRDAVALKDRDVPSRNIVGMRKAVNFIENDRDIEASDTSAGSVVRFSVICNAIARQYSGMLHVSSRDIIFDGQEIGDDLVGSVDRTPDKRFFKIQLNKIDFVFTRRYLHADVGCEIYTNFTKTYCLTFPLEETRIAFLEAVKQNMMKLDAETPRLFSCFAKVCGCRVQTLSSAELLSKSKIVQRWQKRSISTFQYIFYLNVLGGRSFNDLSQYPVYPWILSDYDSSTIDLNDPSVYRDLSKPVGAFHEDRLASLIRIEEDMDEVTHKCLYRTHYSNLSVVAGVLIRTEPFSTVHIALQEGRYDVPDRIFYSVKALWRSVTGRNLDFRELTPEFFFSPYFLVNENEFDLGDRKGEKIDDVVLPPWAKTAHEFISIHRRALESDYVSGHLHDWIDMMFGIHQRSRQHHTLFHPFTYPDVVRSGELGEEEQVLANTHCINFGVCPTKIMNTPHPRRNPSHALQEWKGIPIDGAVVASDGNAMLTSKSMFIDICRRTKTTLSFSWKPNLLCCVSRGYILTVTDSGTSIHIFDVKANAEIGVIPQRTSVVRCITNIDDMYIVAGTSECLIAMWSISADPVLYSRIASHSFPVVCITGNAETGVIVSVDEGHNVCISCLATGRVRRFFTLSNASGTTHHVRALPSGVIAVSSVCESERKSRVDFFDACAHILGEFVVDGSVEAMQVIQTHDFSEFLSISTSARSIYIVSCADFNLTCRFNNVEEPRFLGLLGDKHIVSANKQKLVAMPF